MSVPIILLIIIFIIYQISLVLCVTIFWKKILDLIAINTTIYDNRVASILVSIFPLINTLFCFYIIKERIIIALLYWKVKRLLKRLEKRTKNQELKDQINNLEL